MNIGIYKGAAVLAACERSQENTANNIAGASVPGFRRAGMSFEAVLAERTHGSDGEHLAKGVKNVMPQAIKDLDLQPGELRSTGQELDFAIQGPGFFQVARPDGSMAYTRDGGFHANAERIIVNSQGYPVQGDGGPITLLPRGGRISVNAEGTLLQDTTPIGKIGVFDFDAADKLKNAGDGLLVPKNPEATPKSLDRPNLVSGAIEGSNVKLLREMVDLITVTRAHEAAKRIVQAHDENSEKAIQNLGSTNA